MKGRTRKGTAFFIALTTPIEDFMTERRVAIR
jgi:hypothetical protein